MKHIQDILFFLMVTLGCTTVSGQSINPGDSVLTFDEFIKVVSDHHPVSRMADLSLDRGRAYLLKARGNFDPKINTNLDQKYFDEKEYYSVLSGGLKIPTWYGIEIKGGYDYNRGDFLNDERTVPPDGLLAFGIDIPVLRGIIIDERRAQLKQAKLYQRATEFERLAILNKLFADASIAYFQWQQAYQQMEISGRGVQLAQDIQQMVRGSYRNGALPAIDTLEAKILYQNRQIDLFKVQQSFEVLKIYLSAFMWNSDGLPLELNENIVPQPNMLEDMDIWTNQLLVQGDSLVSQNPELLFANLELEQLDVEVKLKKEDLKPDVRLNYNPLADFSDDLLSNPVDFNNYKWGLRLDVPLLFRKERGTYQLAKIKRESAQLKLDQQRLKFLIALEAQKTKLNFLDAQLDVLDENVRNYQRLVEGERKKFEVGESSVFLINSRQTKYLESLTKQLDTRFKIWDTQVRLISVFGRLPNLLQ